MRRFSTTLSLIALGAAGCAPAAAPLGGSPGAAPAPALRELSSRPRSGWLGTIPEVTGREKPNGMEYRLRHSVPPETPAAIPRALDGLELWIADPSPEGWLAFYRTPLAQAQLGPNARFRAVLFSSRGEQRWNLDLNRFLSRPDQLEIQDIRLADGELYFNEACQSYSRDAGGNCSALLRVDPARGAVLWRTPPRISNDILLVHRDHVIAGYGFTAEPDSLFLVSRATGGVVARTGLDSAHDYLEVVDGRLVVVTTNRVYLFAMESEPL